MTVRNGALASPATASRSGTAFTRRPAVGDEQARRQAWGAKWGAVGRDAALQLRKDDKA